MKFVFNRDDLVATKWNLQDKGDGTVEASHDVEVDHLPTTVRMRLKRVGTTLQLNTGSSSLLHAEMRSVFFKTNTRYVGVM